ncbi:MAG: hypothetical protein VX976_02005 [Pseudomonadota bacterium]|nr:hypothetical protein [Pseudomonadota bacterium]
MKRFLKFIVIFFGILIVILFVITILAIFEKYKNNDVKNFDTLQLIPKIGENLEIKNFQIENDKLYLLLENQITNTDLINIYNARSGNLIGEIQLKK